MKRTWFVAVTLVFMLSTGAALAQDVPDDGGCLGPSNATFGQTEDYKTDKFVCSDDPGNPSGLVALSPMKRAERWLAALITRVSKLKRG